MTGRFMGMGLGGARRLLFLTNAAPVVSASLRVLDHSRGREAARQVKV